MGDTVAGDPQLVLRVMREAVTPDEIDGDGLEMSAAALASNDLQRVLDAVNKRVRATHKAASGSITLVIEVNGYPDGKACAVRHTARTSSVKLPKGAKAAMREHWLDAETNLVHALPEQETLGFRVVDGGNGKAEQPAKGSRKSV